MDSITESPAPVVATSYTAEVPWLNLISGPALRIDAAGAVLPADTDRRDHAAVYLPMHGIWISAEPIALDTPQRTLEEISGALTLAGHSDWRLAHIDYLHLLVNRERGRPYFDPEFFRNVPDDWCWSSSPVAGVASVAWGVSAYDGNVGNDLRTYAGFGLAVRRVGQ